MRYPDLLVTDEARRQHEALLGERADLVRDSVDFLIDAWQVLESKLAQIESPSHKTILMLCRSGQAQFVFDLGLYVADGEG